MKDKIGEAHAEFVRRNIGTYETNVKEVLGSETIPNQRIHR